MSISSCFTAKISVLGQMIYGQTIYGQTVYGQTVEGQTVYGTNNIQGLTVEGTKSIQDKRYTGQTVYWDILLKNSIHLFIEGRGRPCDGETEGGCSWCGKGQFSKNKLPQAEVEGAEGAC